MGHTPPPVSFINERPPSGPRWRRLGWWGQEVGTGGLGVLTRVGCTPSGPQVSLGVGDARDGGSAASRAPGGVGRPLPWGQRGGCVLQPLRALGFQAPRREVCGPPGTRGRPPAPRSGEVSRTPPTSFPNIYLV